MFLINIILENSFKNHLKANLEKREPNWNLLTHLVYFNMVFDNADR